MRPYKIRRLAAAGSAVIAFRALLPGIARADQHIVCPVNKMLDMLKRYTHLRAEDLAKKLGSQLK